MEDFNYHTRTEQVPRPYRFYVHQTLTVSGGTADASMRETLFPDIFSRFISANEILVKKSSADFSLKLNSTSNDPIPIGADEVFSITGFPILDIFVTASGAVIFDLFLQGW